MAGPDAMTTRRLAAAETPPARCYVSGLEEIAKALNEPQAADLRVLLVRPTYRFTEMHRRVRDGTRSDPASHELRVAGYRRQPVTGVTAVRDRSRVGLDAADVAFPSLAGGDTISGLVLYRDGGADSQSPPIAFYQFPRTPTEGAPVIVEWAADGLLAFRRSG